MKNWELITLRASIILILCLSIGYHYVNDEKHKQELHAVETKYIQTYNELKQLEVEISKVTLERDRLSKELGELKDLYSEPIFVKRKYNVSYYCPCYECNQRNDRKTASGLVARSNRTIATPKHLDFGKEVYIDGKKYIVEDRGGAIKGNKVDIFVETHEEALKRGRKQIEGFEQVN